MARIILYCYITNLLEFVNPGCDLRENITENDFVSLTIFYSPLFGAAYFHFSLHVIEYLIQVDYCMGIERMAIFFPR